MLSRCFLDFSVGVWAFVIGLSQISSFFSCMCISPPSLSFINSIFISQRTSMNCNKSVSFGLVGVHMVVELDCIFLWKMIGAT